MKKLTFQNVAKKYLNSRIISDSHRLSIIRTAKSCKYLTAECLNSYIKTRLTHTTNQTVKHNRSILLTLWKFAYENDLIDHMPKNIIKIKSRKPPTKAWTIDQCKYLVDKTFEKDTTLLRNGASLGKFLRCWILIGYESGARYGDIFSFTHNNIENNALRWTMSKTGDPMTKILNDKTIESIEDLKKYNTAKDLRIIGWVIGRRQAIRLMKQHLKDCGLDGTSKFLRRSGATHIEINNPGYAKFHLGHRTSGLAEKSYIDYAQIRNHIPVTPKLI